MAILWNDVKHWLTDATKTAIKEAEDLTRKGKLKIEILNLNRNLEKAFAELGGVVYHIIASGKNPDVKKHAEVRLLARRIRKLEAQLRAARRQWHKKRQQ